MLAETGLNAFNAILEDQLGIAVEQLNITNPQTLSDLRATIGQSFNASAVDKAVAELMMSNRLSTRDQWDIRAFYESDLGRQIAMIDINFWKAPQGTTKRLLMQQPTLYENLSPERRALYDEYIRLAKAPVIARIRQLDRAQAAVAIARVRHLEHLPWSEIDARVDRYMVDQRDYPLTHWAPEYAVVFHDLSDDEFSEYINFLRSPAAQHLYANYTDDLDKALGEQVQRFGDAFALANYRTGA